MFFSIYHCMRQNFYGVAAAMAATYLISRHLSYYYGYIDIDTCIYDKFCYKRAARNTKSIRAVYPF